MRDTQLSFAGLFVLYSSVCIVFCLCVMIVALLFIFRYIHASSVFYEILGFSSLSHFVWYHGVMHEKVGMYKTAHFFDSPSLPHTPFHQLSAAPIHHMLQVVLPLLSSSPPNTICKTYFRSFCANGKEFEMKLRLTLVRRYDVCTNVFELFPFSFDGYVGVYVCVYVCMFRFVISLVVHFVFLLWAHHMILHLNLNESITHHSSIEWSGLECCGCHSLNVSNDWKEKKFDFPPRPPLRA